jgi:hypothetical protein
MPIKLPKEKYTDDLVDDSYLYKGLEKRKEELELEMKILAKVPPEILKDLPIYSQKAYTAILNHTTIMMNLFNDDSFLYKLESQKGKKEFAKSIYDEYKEKSKEELINVLIKNFALKEILKQFAINFSEELKILRPYFFSNISKEYENIHSRQSKKNSVYNQNKEILKRCYEEFSSKLNRKIQGNDYLAYRKYLVSKHPNPPFIPKPKLSKEEKKQSKELQEASRAANTRELHKRWSDATLRKEFERLSGTKATTLKK